MIDKRPSGEARLKSREDEAGTVMGTLENQRDPLEGLRLRVVLDTTTICNLRCRQCFHSLYHVRGLPYRQNEMPPAMFEKILDDLEGHIDSLVLSCSAEPFTNSDLHRYLAIVRRRAGSVEKWIATNGLLLNEDIARDLIETRVDWMVVSIDGARRETYNAIRVGGDFDRLMSRLDVLNRLKAEMGSDRPRLRFNVTLSRANLDELPLFVDLAREKQVAEVTFQHLVPFRGLNLKHQTLLYENRRKVREVFDRTRERGRRLGVHLGDLHDIPNPLQCFGDLLADVARRFLVSVSSDFGELGRTAEPHPTEGVSCNQPWHTVAFTPRAKVAPCLNWLDEPPMGNIAQMSFREIWESDPYQRLRAELSGALPRRRRCAECLRMARRNVGRHTFREQDLVPYEM